MKHLKKRGPSPIPPIELHGVKIYVPHFGLSLGLEQNGGYIEARDPITDAHLWYLKIYTIKYVSEKERDVQDLFIQKIGVRDGFLRIQDGHGRFYAVDINNKNVELIYSPFDKDKRMLREKRLMKITPGKNNER